MAEYYPLLAKAVGSLPNSTPDSRRVVYERARKALIGQLRTMHPPVPDEDIERESVELDRAIERVETELAATPTATPSAPSPDASKSPTVPASSSNTVAPPMAAPPKPAAPPGPIGTLGPGARKPLAPLRPPVPRAPRVQAPAAPPAIEATEADAKPAAPIGDMAEAPRDVTPQQALAEKDTSGGDGVAGGDAAAASEPGNGRLRSDPQRPIAPMPPTAKGPKRPVWIVPAGIAVVVVLVGAAAWKLRVRPETMTRNVPTITEPQQADNGKIADRVGGTTSPETETTPEETSKASAPAPSPTAPQSTPPQTAASPTQTAKQETTPPAINPAVPVAYRAALLVEAPDLPSKVQTFPGTVVWKLNNVNTGPSDTVGLSVEASIDLPQDKTKATVIFERNTDPSLPASHTLKVRFTVDPGSYSGDIKQISVPQMRREGNSDGEPLAGVTVPVIQNSFLVGLSPGNAETANLRLIGDLPWIDVPILLNSGKIAKLTFEKGAAGQRDIAEALSYWQKQ